MFFALFYTARCFVRLASRLGSGKCYLVRLVSVMLPQNCESIKLHEATFSNFKYYRRRFYFSDKHFIRWVIRNGRDSCYPVCKKLPWNYVLYKLAEVTTILRARSLMKFFNVTDVSRIIVLEIILCYTVLEISNLYHSYFRSFVANNYGLAKNESYR